jgi:hypothetical protein
MSKQGIYTCSPKPYSTEILEGSEHKEINARGSFLNCWKEKYPNLKIRASSEEICSECHVVTICYKYKAFQELTRYGSVSFSFKNAELVRAIPANCMADNEE